MSKILVTGGAGFIGSHIVDAYVAAGHEVVVVDNLSSGQRGHVPARVKFVQMDIRDPALRSMLEQERPEIVNHHAAQSSVAVSVNDPRLDADVNILGTLNLLMLCVEFGTKRVIFASTGGAIYGEPDRIPVDETHPARPISPYGISKLVGEIYLQYFASRGLEWAVLRYSNVYGPRQDPHGEAGVVAIFAQAILAGRAPTIFGDGRQTRDFVYVGDVAAANLRALDAPTGQIANIGTGIETTVNDLFAKLADLCEFRGKPAYAPPRPGDVRHIALDVTRAKTWLKWGPQVSLDEGLSRTVKWFRGRK
jgi:UDP-glucose 4-epimerase